MPVRWKGKGQTFRGCHDCGLPVDFLNHVRESSSGEVLRKICGSCFGRGCDQNRYAICDDCGKTVFYEALRRPDNICFACEPGVRILPVAPRRSLAERIAEKARKYL